MYRKGELLKDKYRIERILGSGGTSSVYLCMNLELGNMWAVKHIRNNSLNNGTISEIEIMKKLNHINLPKIADVFYNEEGLFIVESYIEGIPLDRLLKTYGTFDKERVVDWSLQLCDIFIYLHNFNPKPIIYRDMKPSNIIVTKDNRIVLVDFGISKEYINQNAADKYMAGTGAYAAPEQFIKGGVTDPRTDIYSMGVTMYQLLYGRLPIDNTNYNSVKKDKLLCRIDSIIEKCLEKRKADRYQRVEDIRSELQGIKSMIIVDSARQELVLKWEVVFAMLLSVASYSIAALELMRVL